ncbi:MAG: alkaline phosphatase family protein [Nocardioides sp.]
MRLAMAIPLAVTAALALPACGSSRTPTEGPHTTRRVTVPISKVLVVVEENHSRRQMRSGMPYLSRLSERYGYATDWHARRHPSEPNYLAIAGGSTFGVTDDKPPARNARRVGRAGSVFSQALGAGRSAATYAEAMPRPCATRDTYPYAVRHNPWTFFGADRSACRVHDVSAAGFVRAARGDRLPNVGFLIPDLRHDAHDGSLGTADRWLHARLRPVLASQDFRSGALVVVVTADEDDGHSGNVVLTSVLTPRLHHVVVGRRLTHYSLTRFIDGVLGVPALRHAAHAPDLAAAFGL